MKPWEPPQRPEPGRGRTDEGGGGGDENPPTAQPTRERPPNGRDGAAQQGATGQQDMEAEAEAETGTEERAGGTGHPKSHPTGAAADTAVGGPVTAGPAPTEEERDGGAGHPTAQTIGLDPAALAGDTVRAGPAPANKKHTDGGGGRRNPQESACSIPDSCYISRVASY